MPIVKKYVTWKAKKVNDNCYQHPNTDGRASSESNWDINFIETPYKSAEWVYIGIAEHDWALPQARLDALMIVDPDFQFYSATEEEVNTLLLDTYGYVEWEWIQPPMVSYSNHVVTDLRPINI